jgi:protein SCO1/2
MGAMLRHGLAVLLPLLVASVVTFALLQPVKVVPRLRSAPPFTLRTPAGDAVGNAAWWGQPYLVAFHAAASPDLVGDAMVALAGAEGVGRVEIVVGDPPPGVEGWTRLVGDDDDVRRVVGGGFGLRTDAPEPALALIDHQGTLRAIYRADATSPDRIREDVALVRHEAATTGVRRALFEAAHLLACYR